MKKILSALFGKLLSVFSSSPPNLTNEITNVGTFGYNSDTKNTTLVIHFGHVIIFSVNSDSSSRTNI